MHPPHRPPYRSIRSAGLWLVGVLCFAATAAHGVADVRGFIAASGHVTEAPWSWRGGGFGAFDGGAPAGEDRDEGGRAHLHLVLDAAREWDDGRASLGGFVHAVARIDDQVLDDTEQAQSLGLVEAWIEGRWVLRDADRLRFQAGHFILPTSRENIEWAWASPYTLTFSAINTWIGEEVRPTGLAAEYVWAHDLHDLTFGATAFGGNDSAGTLLAWRGFAMGDRLTVWDEVTPLPDLPSLADGAAFHRQRDDGTLPFSEDLDGRAGWASWLGWSRAQRTTVRATWYDNRADRRLHGAPGEQEYAWRTQFLHLGADVQVGAWTFLAEWLSGDTGMGNPQRTHVQVDYEAYHALASMVFGAWRASVRYDWFETVDVDRVSGHYRDDNDGEGAAWTAALLWEARSHPLRLGIEFLDLDATRDAAADAGRDPQVGGRQVRIEARWYFGGR